MTLVQLIVLLVIIGVGLYLLKMIPMDANILKIIQVVVLLVVILWLLEVFGLLPNTPVPRLR